MRQLRVWVLVVWVGGVSVCSVWGADAVKDGGYGEAIEGGRGFVGSIREKNQIPGMSAAVAIDGELVWSEGFGFADLEQGVKATGRTKYRVGSVSKMLTVGAVATLMEQGKLDLDAEVQQYVPTFPKKKYPITTRQLVGHLSGIRHYKPGEQEDKKPYDDVVDGLEVFADDPLLHEPGTKWRYSSFAWNLVSAVVQGAAKEPFLDYMQKAVFDPLGLADTCADERERIIANRTRFYGWDAKQGVPANAREIDVSYKWAGGGFLSTVEDLVKYGSAYLPGSDYLKAETLEEVFTRQKLNDGKAIQNGIGWVVGEDDRGRTVYSHGGNIRGGHSILIIRPKSRVVAAMASNTSYRARFGRDQALRLASFFLIDSKENVGSQN